MITVTEVQGGLILPVWAQPGARRTAVLGEQGGALKVAVTSPPQDGKANEALREALREFLNLKRSQIRLQSGETRRRKTFHIMGITRAELQKRLTFL
jgi:uncharacterized protein (TIGR00251 family)